jgi:hypothetical protein
MKDDISTGLPENEKYPLEDAQVRDVLSDAEYKKLDKRVTRKIDLHILPWIIVCKIYCLIGCMT